MTMYLGRNIVVGLVFIVLLLCSSCWVYFEIAKGTCSIGSFACRNSSKCVPQRSVCNKYNDCPEEDDENAEMCADLTGSTKMIDYFQNEENKQRQQYANICDIDVYPTFCTCNYSSRLFCNDAGLRSVPQNISKTLKHLILVNNFIHTLKNDSFKKFDLEMLLLRDNELTYLPPGIFEGQTNLRILMANFNNLTVVEPGVLSNLRSLEILFLNKNEIETIYLQDWADMVSVRWINISENKLTLVNEEFPRMPKLQEFALNKNEIQEIDDKLLKNLDNLELLSVKSNKITKIHEKAFANLKNLKELNLHNNKISILNADMFASLVLVSKIYIGENPITYLPKKVFQNMTQIQSLNLEGIEILNIDLEMFKTLNQLKSVYFKKYLYCSYAPSVPHCRPLSDGISSMERLLHKPILRYSTWVICISTCIANMLVLWGRSIFRTENKSLSLVIRNLAVSDFLMGVYLLIIAIQDIKFRDSYNREAHHWMSSWSCTITGMIGMISSEVSVLLLLFLSLDRFLLIALPLSRYGYFTVKETILILIGIWGIGFILALIPALELYKTTRFYGVNGLCFPLYIDDPFFIGWEFSAVIFIGINATSLVITGVVYIGMFISVTKTRNATSVPMRDFDFAVRFFFIVITDTICWLPIIIVKVYAYMGAEVPAGVYGWLVVFILPVNSAINPLLYTFTTSNYRKNLNRVPSNGVELNGNRVKNSLPKSGDTASSQLTNRNTNGSIKIVTSNL